MEVYVTAEAKRVLLKKKPDSEAVLRVASMDEGCGCSADVWFEMNWDLPQETDVRFPAGEGLIVAVDPRSIPAFAPEVIVDYEKERGTFVLKNKNQIFLNHIYI
ncbi:iron-sulfur cluster biosynthesis family protein [Lihuaxuella thermophila]|uniref:Iron-sulphur cluster biosynthesis n=1 Tax=Lihuaxuella thermophila TaxID=1173111 RepID=A0A1H8DKG3_9BACL|nr:iron-sulfur cluster biosynthesis family protein [Lihuaxuella thermophila]SEN07750.1 Iron-sulphur cluster biosynthesis [Lihuaxuella thermophila]